MNKLSNLDIDFENWYMRLRFLIALGIIICILFILYRILAQYQPRTSHSPINTITNSPTISVIESTVSFVYDGDTIQISDGTKVRLIGIDAPEVAHDNSNQQCFATESAKLLKELILDQKISIEQDKQKQDVYGRMLGYIWTDNVFINDFMIRQGYAKSMPIKPNTKYAVLFYDAQKDAQENKRGLWKEC